jgi:hypothetical protein
MQVRRILGKYKRGREMFWTLTDAIESLVWNSHEEKNRKRNNKTGKKVGLLE